MEDVHPESLANNSKQAHNLTLRDLDESWQLSLRNEVILFGRVATTAKAAEEVTQSPVSPSRLWLGKLPNAADKRPKLLIVSAEDEYKTSETLPAFAKEQLEKEYDVTVIVGGPRTEHRLKGIEKIKEADVILLAMRRRLLVKEELDLFRAHVASGKAVISIRTSLHAFSPMPKEKTIPEGCDAWLDFDKTILGCNYQNHVLLHFALTLNANSRLRGDQRHYAMTGIRASSVAPNSDD